MFMVLMFPLHRFVRCFLINQPDFPLMLLVGRDYHGIKVRVFFFQMAFSFLWLFWIIEFYNFLIIFYFFGFFFHRINLTTDRWLYLDRDPLLNVYLALDPAVPGKNYSQLIILSPIFMISPFEQLYLPQFIVLTFFDYFLVLSKKLILFLNFKQKVDVWKLFQVHINMV